MLAETAVAAVQSVTVVAPPAAPVTTDVLVERVRPAPAAPPAKGRPVPVGAAD
jgi:hypothetical protein